MTYTEDGLVEQPAIALFSDFGWDTHTCWDELFGQEAEGDLAFGRETRNDVVLTNHLLAALTSLNTDTPAFVIQEAIDEICRDRNAMSDVAANEAIYDLLKNGYTYEASAEDEEDDLVRYVDWQCAENNDFLLCSQMSISGEIEIRRLIY